MKLIADVETVNRLLPSANLKSQSRPRRAQLSVGRKSSAASSSSSSSSSDKHEIELLISSQNDRTGTRYRVGILVFTTRAMLWWAVCGICHGPMSVCVRVWVCLSVTSRSCTKIAKHRKMQTMLHDSPGTLVFWCQKSSEFEQGHPQWGPQKQVG